MLNALLTQPSDFHQLQNFNREEKRSPTDAASICRGASHSQNSLKTCKNKYLFKVKFKEFNIFCRAMKYFPRADISIAYFHIRFSVCVTMGHQNFIMMTCLFSPVSTSRVSHYTWSHITNCHVTGVTRAQSKQEMSGPACDRTQATEP